MAVMVTAEDLTFARMLQEAGYYKELLAGDPHDALRRNDTQYLHVLPSLETGSTRK